MAENLTLELGERNVRVARAGISGGKIDISLLTQQQDTPLFFDLDTEKVIEEESVMLKKLVDMLKISKKPANVVIPDGFTYSQIVTMPKLKEKELLSAIRYQADQFIPMPLEETSLDLEILHEDKVKNQILVLIVAAPQTLIERVERVVEASGLFIDSVESEISAVARLLSSFYTPSNADGGTIFINTGYSSSSFYFFDHRLKLVTDSHSFQAGLSLFLREAQADANIDSTKAKSLLKSVGFSQQGSIDLDQILKPTSDALSKELQKFIASVRGKYNVNTISQAYVFNHSSEILNFDKKIEASVSIPTAIFNPLSFIKRSSAIEPFINELPSFVAALGGCLT